MARPLQRKPFLPLLPRSSQRDHLLHARSLKQIAALLISLETRKHPTRKFLPTVANLAPFKLDSPTRSSYSAIQYPPSPTFSSRSAGSNQDDVELASRRRAAASGSRGLGEYDSLPSYIAPETPMLGGARVAKRVGTSLCLRPRTVGTLVFLALVTLLLLPASNRTAAHAALKNAGVPFPDRIPDRLHDFIDYLNTSADDGSNDLEYLPPPPEEVEDAEVEISTPHTFHSNGHFLVKPVASFDKAPAPHPIITLIQRAEKLWQQKVARQSRTLKEAAAEYRKRYARNPPKGFDEWWTYAKANRIVLVDEYDQIHEDLEPFWALEPSDLLHRVKDMEEREETFTITVENGRVGLEGEYRYLDRAKDTGDLIARFSKHIGDVKLSFTRHDQPACQLGWNHKERMVELAGMGDYFGPSDYVEDGDAKLSNWANGCPPESSLREVELAALEEGGDEVLSASNPKFKSHSPAYVTELSKSRSYIFDHQAAMDICQHPEIMPIHGFTTSNGTNPGPLVPLFTFAKTNIHSDILVTPLEQYSDSYIGYDPDWGSKPYNKLLWRGSTTGAIFEEDVDWQESQRSRLHFMTHETTGRKTVLLAEKEGEMREEEMSVGAMNKAYMDASFSGIPMQCDLVTCEWMRKNVDFKATMGLDESYRYKYVMDVDGNGWSGRFHRLMSMKATVLKSTLFPEWYSDRIQPWVHYVPVKVDYSDLYDIMTFFRGTPDGQGAHEDLAQRIGVIGKIWARDHWRKQDMAAYMFRLSLEWSRLLHRDDAEPQDYWD